jgi:hypothetical protein
MEPLDHPSTPEDSGDDFVGSPTEFADAQEVPEWVANIAKLIFFLPAAWVTTTTIPIIMVGCSFLLMLLVCAGLSVLASLL